MKSRKSQIQRRSHKIPSLRFDSQELTSFAGIVVFLALFKALQFKQRLRTCFAHLNNTIYGHHIIMLLLVVHKLLGFRKLRGMDQYRQDPFVCHMLGLWKMPDVATTTRHLKQMDEKSYQNVLQLSKDLVSQRLRKETFKHLTLDFDGSVVWTRGCGIEGTAVGFNKEKKGARGYYPLLCTISQTSQVWDMLHRPGNVHDSNGACRFMVENIQELRRILPHTQLECRGDSAFFSEGILLALDLFRADFTISVPFERFPVLKQKIEKRKRWRRLNKNLFFFEDKNWQPNRWGDEYGFRFVFVRHRVPKIRRDPVQLDLFVPRDFEYEYKVIVTNKKTSARNVLRFHNGRGCQENLIGELKSSVHFDYLPCRKQIANQHFMAAALLAHNLGRELQMHVSAKMSRQPENRSASWLFRKLTSFRQRFLIRAGRLVHPRGNLTLLMPKDKEMKREMTRIMGALAA